MATQTLVPLADVVAAAPAHHRLRMGIEARLTQRPAGVAGDAEEARVTALLERMASAVVQLGNERGVAPLRHLLVDPDAVEWVPDPARSRDVRPPAASQAIEGPRIRVVASTVATPGAAAQRSEVIRRPKPRPVPPAAQAPAADAPPSPVVGEGPRRPPARRRWSRWTQATSLALRLSSGSASAAGGRCAGTTGPASARPVRAPVPAATAPRRSRQSSAAPAAARRRPARPTRPWPWPAPWSGCRPASRSCSTRSSPWLATPLEDELERQRGRDRQLRRLGRRTQAVLEARS